MDLVHIGFCCDERYFTPLAVAMQSVIDTAHDPQRLHFWILTQTPHSAQLPTVRAIATAVRAQCTVLSAEALAPLLADVPADEHITIASYFRLFLPELLPIEVPRLIYLDCDLVVQWPIEELWATSLDGCTLAAVIKPRAGEHRAVGVRHETDFFNAGVLLLDVAQWRHRRIRAAAIDFALHHPGRIHGHDQAALNHVVNGEWKRLDPRWNQQFKFFMHTSSYLRIGRVELSRLRRAPFIIHYTTDSKPWHALNDHPLRARYFEFLDRTPFRGWRPAPVECSARVAHALGRLVPHWLRPAVLRNVYRPRYHSLKDWLRRWNRPPTPRIQSHPL